MHDGDLRRPTVVSAGEPAGIGPDIVLTYAAVTSQQPNWLTLGDPEMFSERAHQLGLHLNIVETVPEQCHQPAEKGHLRLLPPQLAEPCTAGLLNPNNARYVIDTLTTATQLCSDQRGSALVTAPVHKGIINEAGIPFTGHTELLAELTHTEQVVMMLAADQFRVALATTHLPLSAVPDAITPQLLEQVITIIHQEMVDKYGIANPTIRVCGLNPHAGEQGHMGREEIEVINPVIDTFSKRGMNISGAYPADTLLTPLYTQNTDVFLAMYHDQGLPVLKYAGFGHAINITLGLPIIRTSVDHGTALTLAGSGKADPSSFIAALTAAVQISQNRHNI